jgi:hypothetical protein
MGTSSITKIYAEFKETKSFTLPAHLLASARGYNLVCWLKELLLYYETVDLVVRPFDDLPPLRLSALPDLPVTAQDIHRFIINDLNLIPPRMRRMIINEAVSGGSAEEAWQKVLPILAGLLSHDGRDTVIEDLSWKFSPVAELLVALTWIFMEREQVIPPKGTRMVCGRFPYCQWIGQDGALSLWEPEQPLCRWERLAFDVYEQWLKQNK